MNIKPDDDIFDTIDRTIGYITNPWFDINTNAPLPINRIPKEELPKLPAELLSSFAAQDLIQIIDRLTPEQIKSIIPNKLRGISIDKLEKVIHKLTIEQITAIPIKKLRRLPMKAWKKVPSQTLIRLKESIVCKLPRDRQIYIRNIYNKTVKAAPVSVKNQTPIKRTINLPDLTQIIKTTLVTVAAVVLLLMNLNPLIQMHNMDRTISNELIKSGYVTPAGELTMSPEDFLNKCTGSYDYLGQYALAIRSGLIPVGAAAEAYGMSPERYQKEALEAVGANTNDPMVPDSAVYYDVMDNALLEALSEGKISTEDILKDITIAESEGKER